MNKLHVIYNPAAAQGRALQRLPEVHGLLETAGLSYSVQLTERRGHAIELAREAAARNQARAIVAAGGDGTSNEVLNGIMRAKADGADTPPMGVLCVGRGNDFAHGVGIPTDLAGGVATLRNGAPRVIDVGHLRGGTYPEGRYFGNGIGIGFDTIVGFEAAKMKRIKGFASYLAAALKTLLFYYRAPLLRLRTDDGEESRECIQVSVMNGRRMGGAFYMAPRALPDDGLLDLCIAGTPRRGEMLALIVKYLKGAQEGNPHITMTRSRTFVVSSDGEPLAIHADGETISTGHTSLEVSLGGTTTILAPADPG